MNCSDAELLTVASVHSLNWRPIVELLWQPAGLRVIQEHVEH